MNLRYRINEPDVTHESFDAEILVINLKNGNYYSLLGTAIPTWKWLTQGASVAEITPVLAQSCRADETVVGGALASFAETLEKENLLVRREHAASPGPLATLPLPTAFTPPQMDRYTDMQQLLLMDPIHEVDATGWPMPKNQEPNGR
jgi:hypothetical protein